MSTTRILGAWTVTPYQVELKSTHYGLSAKLSNPQGQSVHIPRIYCGVSGTVPQSDIIKRIETLSHENISVFVYPQEQPSEVWIFEATQTVGREIYSAKMLLKQEPPDFPKALGHLKTARKLQSKKGDATEIKYTIIQVKRQCLILKWTTLSLQCLRESEASIFNETLERYEDNNIIESFQELLEVEKQFSPHHHLMSAFVHEEKSEYLAAMEAYLALSEDNPNDLACIKKAYDLLEKACKQQEDLIIRKEGVQMAFERSLSAIGHSQENSPTCFICFNVEEKDVGNWLEETLVPDMDCVGIRPIFCLPELSHEQDLDNFHELARQADKVIVVCTPTLKTKFEERKKAPTGVAQEIAMVRRRYRDPNKTDTIFPIFPKGELNSLPTAYFESVFGIRFSPFKEASFDLNYFSNAFDLLFALKGISRRESCEAYKRFLNEVKTILKGEVNQEKVQVWRASKRTRVLAMRASIIQRVSDYTQIINLPPLPAHFTGREGELATLHAACQQKSRVAIAGLGGVGKTALALKYADQFKLDYQFVHFMPASTVQLAIEGLLKLADDLHVPRSDKPEERLQWLKTTLERFSKDYLLIFDGMDQEGIFNEIEKYLPDSGRCLLLTTRMPQDAKLLEFEIIELHPLTLEDAVKYLLTVTHSQDFKAAERLAEKLGRLPLALTHAARYIDNKKISIHKYIEHFDQYALKLFGNERLKLKPNEQTILTTWQISIHAIEQKDNGLLAREILDVFALLGQAPISLSLVEEWCKACHPEISDLDLEDALNHLLEYSMIGSPQSDHYAVHLLVQSVTRYQMPQERQQTAFRQAVETLLSILRGFNKDDPTTWAQPKSSIPHAISLVETPLMAGIDSEKQWSLFKMLGGIYLVFGDVQQALGLYQKSLNIEIQTHGKNHPDVAESYNNIGMVYQSLEENIQAQEFHEQALKIAIQVYGENHPNIASSYNNIGTIYQSLGENTQALEFFHKALKIQRQVHGENHPHIASSYNNIGMVYQSLGENTQAKELFQKALKIQLHAYGENHPNVAKGYNNIAAVYQNLGENAQALEFLQKALKIQLQVHGENHPDVAETYNNIGVVYKNLGESTQALEFLQNALKIQLQVYGENHPDVALNYCNTGTVYLSLGENVQAMEFHQKALKIDLHVYGENHPSVASNYCNIGGVYQNLGENTQALEFFQKALKIWRNFYPDSHPWILACLNNIKGIKG